MTDVTGAAPNAGGNNTDNKTPAKVSFDPSADLWNAKPANATPVSPPPPPPAPNANGTDKQFNFEDYFKGLNLFDGVTMDMNDAASVNAGLATVMQRMFKQVMIDNGRMMEHRLDQHGKAIKTDINSASGAEKIVDKMYEAIPSTRDKNVAPIAKSVLRQMMITHNGDEAMAIDGVKAFLKHMSTVTNTDLGDSGNNRAGTGGYGNNGNRHQADPNYDWAAVLGPQNAN